jgi:very-short-patch-repair endonuclease/predicted transcriptional regulator of viral defense system
MLGMRAKLDTAAALAADQHGVVTRAQLLQAGLKNAAITRRVDTGRLHVIYRGVYAVGHRVLTLHGHWMAAVLACGPNAALSHTTAAAASDLRQAGGAIHVTIPGRTGRQAPKGIRLHRSPTLTARDVTEIRGIRVTKVARTIIDLARIVSQDELERIVYEADRRGVADFAALRSARSASLQAVLRAYDPAPTRSQLERRFLRLCREHGLPRPEVNAVIDGMEVDFVWRDRRLIVEVDGYAYHRSPAAFEKDRERDVRLAMKGWTTRRFTWRQVDTRARWVAAAIG